MQQSRDRGWMVLTLFFFSGATALVYEVVWSKLLSQMFGSTIYAQTVVLAAFMGGLALGNWIVGRWSDRLRQPVRAYGCLEIAIGIYALLFLALDRVADQIFVGIGTHIVERSGLLLVLKGVLSVGLLLGPTMLMGGTLPLLAAWLQKSYSDPGRRSARFYSVNSLGAVLGAALAGFWLVQEFGMAATLRITAIVNLIVGTLAILLSREATWKDAQQGVPTEADRQVGPTELLGGNKISNLKSEISNPGWAGLIVALTGGISMGLELLASRSLALIFGSSLQSLTVVLIAFILGIGLGSAWIASPRRREVLGERRIVLLLCVAAAWVAALVFRIEQWVDFYRLTRVGLERNGVGYVYHLLLTSGLSLVVLGVPAACIGAVLPLMMRAVSREQSGLGAKVGRLLTWNTGGAVAGTVFTGFVLMPVAGLRNAFVVLALVLAIAGLTVACRSSRRAAAAACLVLCGLIGSLFVFGDTAWQCVISSGAFRIWETRFEPGAMRFRLQHVKILFYEDGPDATVSVEQEDAVLGEPGLALRINGKPDAGTHLDVCNQLLLAHLPLLAKPDAKDVFVLGLGSGMTAGAVLDYPIERLDLAENCEPVVEASKFFEDWNHHVLSDLRTRLWNEDARTVLKLLPQRYDVIISEPSNPWTVGVGSVFSREFYEAAARRLKPGGIVSQWFHLYEMSDDILRLVLRTFGSVFPFVEIWDTGTGDIVMLGSQQPWPTGPAVYRRGFNIERVRNDLAMIDIRAPEALLARQLASQRTGFAIGGEGPLQSDLDPILEYTAPFAFYVGEGCFLLNGFDERTREQLVAPKAKRALLASLQSESVRLMIADFLTVNGELAGALQAKGLQGLVPCAFRTPTSSPPPGAEGGPLGGAAEAFAAGNLRRAEELAAPVLREQPGNPQAGYLMRVIAREKQARANGWTLSGQ